MVKFLGGHLTSGISRCGFSIRDIRHTQQREARVKAEPEHNVAHQSVLLKHRRARDDDERDLDELHEEQVESVQIFNRLESQFYMDELLT